jgi:peptide/nickel transport system substrate-binding protein
MALKYCWLTTESNPFRMHVTRAERAQGVEEGQAKMDSNYWNRGSVSRRRVLRTGATGFAGLAATALVGCGSDGSDDATLTATSAPGATIEAPKRGGSVRLPDLGTDGADIHTSVSAGGQGNAQWVLDTLMGLDEPVPATMKQVPQLAASLEQPDNQTYLYKLRPGVKWQDVKPVNGRAFTAEDVVYSLKRMSTNDPKFTRRAWFSAVQSIEATDAETVRIRMTEPNASFAYLMASPWTAMVAREQVEADGGILKNYIGTGPYVVQSLEPNVSTKLKRNPNYWGATGNFDDVEIVRIADPQALASAFRANQVQNVNSVAADNVKSFKEQNPGATLYKAPRTGIGVVAMNTKNGPFKDPRVRQAIAHACDIDGWISVVVGGEGFRTGPISPEFTSWGLKQGDLKYGKGDIAEAKKLLEAAAVKPSDLNGPTITIGNIPEFTNSSVQFQGDMKQLGVDISIQPLSVADWTSKFLVARDYTYSTGNEFSPDDPFLLYNKFHSAGTGNYSGYANPKLDSLLTAQQREFDEKKRQDLVYQAQKLIIDDVAVFFTFIQWSFHFTQGIKNWRESAITGNKERWNARNAWLA